MMKHYSYLLFLFVAAVLLSACQSTGGNVGQLVSYTVPAHEAHWIRQGEPILYEDEPWYPRDEVEMLQDSEVLAAGEYKGVQFFIEKADVRPFNRLYTKYGRNQFRIYEKRLDK